MLSMLIPQAYTLLNKILNLSTIDKIHIKCIVIDGSVVKGIREPLLFSFLLYKFSGYKVFCDSQTIPKTK